MKIENYIVWNNNERRDSMRVLDELEIKRIMEESRDGIIMAATKKCLCTPIDAPCYYHRIAYKIIDCLEDMMIEWSRMIESPNVVESEVNICVSEDQFNDEYTENYINIQACG